MRKARILLFLGIWLIILPYLGFPYSWKEILTTLTGFIVLLLSYLFYREYRMLREAETFDNFSENSIFEEIEKELY